MACSNCSSNTNTPVTFDVQYFYNNQCNDCSTSGCAPIDSSCVFYKGPNLSCSGINTNDSIEASLQKIDEQICSALGDYSTYQMHCLPMWYQAPISQESEFVNAITGYVCQLRNDVDTFIDGTFVDYQDTVTAALAAITSPGLTCTSASVLSTDTLFQVLSKYCGKFASIDALLNISSVTWNACFSVPSAPVTIVDGFNLLANQICQVKASSGGALPTFNNSGNCLAGATNDSLVSTINRIITKLCTTAIFNVNNVSWGCLNDGASNLQTGFQTVVDKVSSLTQNVATFSDDFVVTQNDVDDPCAGVSVALAAPLNVDRFVAVNSSDTTPSTLVDKLTAGDGVTLDVITTPGTMIISSTATSDDHRVLADAADDTPGYLDAKVNGSANSGITLSTGYNSGTKKVDFTLTVDKSALFNALLDILESNSTLYAKFCEKVAGCPSPCSAPTNVQAVPVSGSTTTTTTTSTTTTTTTTTLP